MVTGNYFFIKIVPLSIFLNKSAIYTERVECLPNTNNIYVVN